MHRSLDKAVKLVGLIACHQLLSGYVLFSKVGATLPVTPGNPTLNFKWDGQAPTLTDKDKVSGGTAEDSDHDAFAKIITLAMENWSNVAGSFVKVAYTEDPSAKIDPQDKVFSIAIKPLVSASEGAYAAPQLPTDKGSNNITDCDIDVPPTSVPAVYMLHTVTHELGHCLGFGHSHTNYGAIMGYSGSANQTWLGPDDIAALIYLYPDPNDPSYKKNQELIGVCGVVGVHSRAMPFGITLLLLPVGIALSGRRRSAAAAIRERYRR